MRVNFWRGVIAVTFGLAILSCNEGPTAPDGQEMRVRPDVLESNGVPRIVISQIYGGGGNSGATYRNDFIELFNPGSVAVNVTGWSVQYASAAGSTWQVTTLSGTIQPGAYYLIQEAANTGGTVNLPTPDVIGTIAMNATVGKVMLVAGTTALSGTCGASATAYVNGVSFGTTATDCGQGTTAAPSNTNAVLRNSQGCAYTGTLSADFAAGAPAPRNSSSPANACSTTAAPVATVTVAPDAASVPIGTNQTFTATGRDASNNVVGTTFTWTSSNTAVATIDAATGVATPAGAGTTTITAQSANGVTGTALLTVTAAALYDVVISQVYGGGGNSGATYTHDYVELFNRGTEPADISGWRVQYASSTASTWTATTLPVATIQPGKYYLVQLASNAAVGSALPAADAIGTTNLSGSAGKIIVTLPGVAPTVACPSGSGIIDRVGYGTTSNCGAASDWNGTTATLSSTTAAFRRDDGCVKTGSVGSDFIVLTPNPRNSLSTERDCSGGPPRPRSTATLVINELMADPANAESASWGEWFEVRNYGTLEINLRNWTIISGGTSQPNHTIAADVIVPAGGHAVLGRGGDVLRNGGVTLDYNYFTGSATTIWLDDNDYLMMVDNVGALADSVVWTSMTRGVSRGLRDTSLPHADANGASWGYSTTIFGDGDYGTPGADNGTLSDVAPVLSANKITISGRTSADAPLPVGFEAQIFATETNSSGVVIPTTFTFAALTPEIATIDDRGVVHAVAPGTARFRALAADGTGRIHSLIMVAPVASTTAVYLDNTAFGVPTDDNPADDFLIVRPQFTTSFNGTLGIPNWVAYDLNKTDIVAGQDRCNCFTFDPELVAAGFTRYTTADYTGAGAFAGYGIDRGHMTRSFDRTAGTLDNARTYYFSNVVPQTADMNQGPWANMENYLGSLAQTLDKEVYIHVGPAGSIGTVKNEGKITIPKYTWKIALILERGQGLADVHDYRDVEVIAAVMPNVPNIRNVDWNSYRVTADSVEKLTGYKFLTLLSDRTQRALKTNTKPPLGAVDGPYQSFEGSAVNMSASGSIDPNGTITSYQWNFGDGGIATGSTASHTYTQNGVYTLKMIVTDNDGLVDTVMTTSRVTNVAPSVLSFAGATLLPGETYTATGTFTDPGADTWTGTVNYGDGSGDGALSITGRSFSLSHTYTSAGTFTVTASVFDGDDTGTGSATVTVLTFQQGVQALSGLVDNLITAGALSSSAGGSLKSKLDAASGQLAQGSGQGASGQLKAFENEVSALVKSGRLSPSQANTLLDMTTRLLRSIGG